MVIYWFNMSLTNIMLNKKVSLVNLANPCNFYQVAHSKDRQTLWTCLLITEWITCIQNYIINLQNLLINEHSWHYMSSGNLATRSEHCSHEADQTMLLCIITYFGQLIMDFLSRISKLPKKWTRDEWFSSTRMEFYWWIHKLPEIWSICAAFDDQ